MRVYRSIASSTFPLQGASRHKGVAKGSLHLFRRFWEKAGVRAGALDLTNTAVWTGSCN